MRSAVVAALAALVMTPSAFAQEPVHPNPARIERIQINTDTAIVIPVTATENGFTTVKARDIPAPFGVLRDVCMRADGARPSIVFQNRTKNDLTIRFVPNTDQVKNADGTCQPPCPSLNAIDAGVTAVATAVCNGECTIDTSQLRGCDSDLCKQLKTCDPQSCKLDRTKFHDITAKIDPGILALAAAKTVDAGTHAVATATCSADQCVIATSGLNGCVSEACKEITRTCNPPNECTVDAATHKRMEHKIDSHLLELARHAPAGTITDVSITRLAACETSLCRALRAACDPDRATTCTLFPDQFPALLAKCESICAVTRSAPGSTASFELRAAYSAQANLPAEKAENETNPIPAVVFDSSHFTGPDKTPLDPPYEFVVTGTDSNGKPAETRLLVTTGRRDDCLSPTAIGAATEAALVPLDSTGVASWRYQNPRNPACITCEDQLVRGVAFRNRTADRTFVVSLTVPKEIAPQLVRAGAFQNCKADKACTVSLNVPPQNVVVFDKSLIGAIPKMQLLKFDVSFFDETEKPAHPSAYLRQAYLSKDEAQHYHQLSTADIMAEPDGGSPDINVIASISGIRDVFVAPVPKTVTSATDVKCPGIPEADQPTFDPKKYDPERHAALCADNPYTGGYRKRYTTLGRLELAKRLGSRADAFVGLAYRDEQEPLGTPQLSRVGASQYYINVYAVNGLSLRFGRTTWANSSSTIAFLEKGDGYQVSFHELSFTNVVKRESATGTADRANNDARSLIMQLKSVAFPWFDAKESDGQQNKNPLRMFRSFDATVIRGTDKISHTYSTYGGEIFYAISNLGCHGDLTNCSRTPTSRQHRNFGTIAGSLAGYESTRHLRHDADCTDFIVCRDGRGRVALVTATWTPAVRPAASGTGFETVRSVTVRWGIGSGNRTPIGDAPTGAVDHSYLGETASFAPGDSVLLGTFQGAIDAKSNFAIGPGLANKRYWNFTYTDNTTSPLEWLVELLDLQGEVAGKSTIVQFHDFRFRYPVFGETDAGREASVQFLIESPRGIKVTVGASYFDPGAALQPIVKTRVWTAFSSVSLKL